MCVIPNYQLDIYLRTPYVLKCLLSNLHSRACPHLLFQLPLDTQPWSRPDPACQAPNHWSQLFTASDSAPLDTKQRHHGEEAGVTGAGSCCT